MKREDAIKAIQDFLGWFKEDSDIHKALEMAIKALEQEPDAISREDALIIARSHTLSVAESVAMLMKLPPVTPSRPKGQWIKKGNTLKCPFYGAKGEDIKDDYCFKFCPNCGAEMEESEGSE